ncbi:metal-dependent hydrolase [Marinicrinis lubricantis]|uniref:UPF0173 metal-dependent hydrolase ACFPXP_05300 n=1 Tax=Marinicrinis lubricantis TaxID=2086470 RepID=A0ABW1ILC8_9BACL
MHLTYLGHSCILLESEGKRVIIDPFLTGNPHCPFKPEELKVDAIFLTHAHDDHFGDSIEIAKQSDCLIVAVNELAIYCQQRGVKAHPMNPGGTFETAGFTVKMTQAFHSSSLNVDGQLLYAGQPVGLLVTAGGKTLYHAGDTCLFSDMKMIGELHEIDAAALPIGDNFTMGPKDALIAAEWIGAEHVIPLHYNTFPVIEQDAAAFAREVERKGMKGHAMSIGDELTI